MLTINQIGGTKMRDFQKVSNEELIKMHYDAHLSYRQMALIYGVSHVTIAKRFTKIFNPPLPKKKGINPTKYVSLACNFCGKEFQQLISIARKNIKHYCKNSCYFASLENPGYHPWRVGQRLARAIVSQYFALQDGNVTHHKDGDNRNNDRINLAVYQSQSDHLGHHRGKNIKPIWDGAEII